MDVREIRDVTAWDEHEAAWRRITDESPAATVFQTWEWMRAWWDHYGDKNRLWVLAVVEDKSVLGFAPLYLPPRGMPLRIARLIGTGPSDYGDMLALPGCEDEVMAALWAFLGERRGAWDWLDLQQVRPGSVAARALPTAGPVRATLWTGETCPYLPLPADWETFRKSLGKKLRGNIGYYERTLRKLYRVEMRTATTQTLAGDMTVLFDLHQQRWNQRWLPGAFAARTARAFHQDVAARLLQRGMLRLHILLLDGVAQAALYCFQSLGRCAYYLGGFEPSLSRLSIGTVLTAHAIRHAIEVDRAAEFDFLRGDEPYKYRWGARDRVNRRLSVTHAGLRPALLAAAGRAALAAELGIKSWMHRRHSASPRAAAQGAGGRDA